MIQNFTLRANCRPSKTARLKGSVSFFRSAFAFFRALSKSSKIVGSRPFRTSGLTNKSNAINWKIAYHCLVSFCNLALRLIQNAQRGTYLANMLSNTNYAPS